MGSVLTGRINSDPRLTGGAVLTIASIVIVSLGVWLPWLIVKPGYSGPVPQVYISGMETGIAGQDYLILGVGAVGLLTAPALSTRYSRRRLGGIVRGITGLLITLLTLLWVADTTVLNALWWFVDTNNPETGTLEVYVLGNGVYLTLFGSILLMIAGRTYLTHGRRRNTESGKR